MKLARYFLEYLPTFHEEIRIQKPQYQETEHNKLDGHPIQQKTHSEPKHLTVIMSTRDSLKSSNHSKRNSDMNSRRGSNHSKRNSDMNNSRRGSNHLSKRNSGDLSSSLRGSINKLWTNRRCQSEHLRRKNQYNDDSDNDSVISDCSFASDSQPPTQKKPISQITLPETFPNDTAIFSNDSLKLIYLSWDVIRNMAQGKEKLVEKLFEL